MMKALNDKNICFYPNAIITSLAIASSRLRIEIIC